MNVLDAAKALAENGPFVTVEEESCCAVAQCAFCLATDHSFKQRHEPDCPWLALPQIVAALEMAEKIAATSPDDESIHGPYGCHFCDGVLSSNDKQVFPETGHAEDCPWQALVAAFKGKI